MKIKIDEISFHFGSQQENLKNLKQLNPSWDTDKIYKATGIDTRYCSSENETALDLAIKATTKLKSNYKEIDLLIFVTQSPDYILPTTACIAQEKLSLKRSIAAFDINLGCSGFIYALSVAASLINSNQAKKALLLCADTYTKYISINDRTSRPLFSDAGASILISKSNSSSKVGPFIYGTDGSGKNNLILRNSGTQIDTERPSKDFFMNGAEVLMFTMQNIPKGVNQLLNQVSLKISDIDFFLFHQASKVVMQNISRKLNIDHDKFLTNYDKYGNTVSCTIPILLKEKIDAGIIKRGNKLMLFGFGVGYSYGGCIIEY